jgi:hypothetical protein
MMNMILGFASSACVVNETKQAVKAINVNAAALPPVVWNHDVSPYLVKKTDFVKTYFLRCRWTTNNTPYGLRV